MAKAVNRARAHRFGENTRDKFICATRAGHGDAVLVLPIEFAPGVASAKKELKFLMGGRGFRLGEVYETVKGELDLVTEFMGPLNDSIEEFANLDEGRVRVNLEMRRGHTAAHLRIWVWLR